MTGEPTATPLSWPAILLTDSPKLDSTHGPIAMTFIPADEDQFAEDPADIEVGARERELAAIRGLANAYARLRQEIGKVIIGQAEVVDQLLIAMFCRSHCLLMGVPGLAKTLLVSTLAKALSMNFKRIQFTPDMMPSDITGTEVLEEDHATGHKQFVFVQGPVFTNLLLADEINRTPPKTQAALLEAMQEKNVTVGKKTYVLQEPFMVMATQNPIEQEGTYPLPEAQLDRFMFMVWVDYPSDADLKTIIKRTTAGALEQPKPVLDGPGVLELRKTVRMIPISDHVVDYIVRLVTATHPNDTRAPEALSAWTMARDSGVGNSQSEVNDTTQKRVSAPRKALATTPS